MLPTAFQKMRANRGDLKPREVPPARAEVMRANRRRAGEALVRRINRLEAEMVGEWHAEFQTRLADRYADSFVRFDPPPPRRSWWPVFRRA